MMTNTTDGGYTNDYNGAGDRYNSAVDSDFNDDGDDGGDNDRKRQRSERVVLRVEACEH